MTTTKKKKKTKKKTKSWKDLSSKQQEEAKSLFMEYEAIAVIADKFGIPRTTVQYHASTHWNVERETLKAELFRKWGSAKKSAFIKMQDKAAKIIEKSMSHLLAREVPPTPREAKDAVAILESLDKITP